MFGEYFLLSAFFLIFALANHPNNRIKMQALFINGSPRKNGNTAKLLKRAMEGATEAGAETELINLYDRSLNFKGCMSCFACKLKGGKTSTRLTNSAKDCARRVKTLGR